MVFVILAMAEGAAINSAVPVELGQSEQLCVSINSSSANYHPIRIDSDYAENAAVAGAAVGTSTSAFFSAGTFTITILVMIPYVGAGHNYAPCA